jgi:hypothetical protein
VSRKMKPHFCLNSNEQILCSIFRASWINLSRNNQQMSRYSTLFPANSLHVSDTFRVHHQEINKIKCICNLWYGNSIMRPAWLSQDDGRPHDTVTVPEVAYAVNFIDLLMMDTECVRNM